MCPALKFEAVIGSGPLWFVETLLIFSLVYAGLAACRRLRPASTTVERALARQRRDRALCAAAGDRELWSALWRPIGWNCLHLTYNFPFSPSTLSCSSFG